jgi:hypothetical protein
MGLSLWREDHDGLTVSETTTGWLCLRPWRVDCVWDHDGLTVSETMTGW